MWIISLVACLAEAPEEALVTRAELDAAVQAAVQAAVGEPPAPVDVEAYLQSPAGQAILDARIEQKLEEYLATQTYATLDDLATVLEGYVPQSSYDTFVSETEEALASSVLLVDTEYVVASCDELNDQLDALQTVRFGPDVVVTLRVEPGSTTCAQAIFVEHPQGSQIAIVGDTTDPTQVTFTTSSGFVVWSGGSIGLVDGFRLVAATPNTGVGLEATMNGSISLGEHMVIEGFYYGELAGTGGVIDHRGNATEHLVIRETTEGISASTGGVVDARYAEIEVEEACFTALWASYGGTILADQATVDVTCIGALSQLGGVITGDSADMVATGVGVRADRGGYISWENGTSAGSTDFDAFLGGGINALGATGTSVPAAETDQHALPSAVYQ